MVAELDIMSRLAMPQAIAARVSHGGKGLKPEDFNPYHQSLMGLQARLEIPEHSAKVFKQLKDAGHMPSWVIKNCDIDKILRAA